MYIQKSASFASGKITIPLVSSQSVFSSFFYFSIFPLFFSPPRDLKSGFVVIDGFNGKISGAELVKVSAGSSY